MDIVNAIGRRKAAVARVYVSEGSGKITINNRDIVDYFTLEQIRFIVKQPLQVTENEGKYDVKINLMGGGINGQAEAARLGIARALVKIDEETNKGVLKANKLLTRDSRVVERKKPGQPKARKRFQFSKR